MLRYRKVGARWVPHMLIPEMKQHWWQMCQEQVWWHFTPPIIQPRSGTLNFLSFPQAEGTPQGTQKRVWWWGARSCTYLFAGDYLKFLSLWDATTRLTLAFVCWSWWWIHWKIPVMTLQVKGHFKLSENVQLMCKSSILEIIASKAKLMKLPYYKHIQSYWYGENKMKEILKSNELQ